MLSFHVESLGGNGFAWDEYSCWPRQPNGHGKEGPNSGQRISELSVWSNVGINFGITHRIHDSSFFDMVLFYRQFFTEMISMAGWGLLLRFCKTIHGVSTIRGRPLLPGFATREKEGKGEERGRRLQEGLNEQLAWGERRISFPLGWSWNWNT